MRVSRLSRLLEVTVHPPAAADPELARAAFDSRRVQPGDLYCALPGTRCDGRQFLAQARQRDAAAVLIGAPAPGLDLPQLLAPHGVPLARLAGRAAAALAGDPSREMWVAAVTGTNGKTTVVHLVQQALQSASIPCARSGTLGFAFGAQEQRGLHTTPPADELQDWLRGVRARGARALVLEASSHGLSQDRLSGLAVDVAAWTNLTHDHLDYHKDLEEYAAAKARLVHGLSSAGVAFLPAGDARILQSCRGAPARRVTWSLDAPAELAGRVAAGSGGIALEVLGSFGPARIESRLVGRHNAENLLLAFGVARCAGLTAEEAAAGLGAALGAPGRLQRVAAGAPWLLYVDYAHTPDALTRALAALRQAHPGRRLGIVFGAGGDRDPHKRAPMGRAAAGGADWCLVTSDNPRSEDPASIAAAVAAGVAAAGRAPEVELDRRVALHRALRRLQPGEVLLVAGKGHEDYQEIQGVRHPFDDCVELEKAAACSV
ncbi:MAG: UDP-N-acetylmuramoyl-L-alanyl-D-glutamate--2,6-diaminopimelate ligase [Planctomycetota bacterium]|nr:MAG: UDP-N-acetylmuramoyl-L-alanyl-D-glutamate--2,6-diaminopimelate ligase [Planctomycetota bacterium]